MISNQHSRYKHLGVEGLEIIPSDWNYDRMKNIGIVNGRVGWKALKASEYVDKGYFFLATPNIKDREIDYLNVNYITYERYKESPEIMLRNNDILLTKDGSTLGTINIVKNLNTPGTVNSSIAVLRFKKQFNSRYFFYLISSNFIQSIIQVKKDGMGVPHLFQKDINNFLLLIPPDKEQDLISNFLDQKTAAIDKKILLLETKMAYYKELSKSIINEAVCKGLKKNVPLKESGIDWIGQIPKHWQVGRFKSFAKAIKGKTYDFFDNQEEGNLPSLSLEFLRNENSSFTNYCFCPDKSQLVCEKDYIIVWDGAGVGEILRGKKGVLSSTIAKLVFEKKKIIANYFYFLRYTLEYTIKSMPTGMGIPHLNPHVLNNFFFPIPPVEEQTAVADYLDTKTKTIEAIVKNITAQIEALKELRKTLINDVVTGKLKVTEE